MNYYLTPQSIAEELNLTAIRKRTAEGIYLLSEYDLTSYGIEKAIAEGAIEVSNNVQPISGNGQQPEDEPSGQQAQEPEPGNETGQGQDLQPEPGDESVTSEESGEQGGETSEEQSPEQQTAQEETTEGESPEEQPEETEETDNGITTEQQ